MEFLIITAAVIVGNILADGLTAAFVVWRTAKARATYNASLAEWERDLTEA